VAVGTRRLTGRQGDGKRKRGSSVSYKSDKNNMYTDIQKIINNRLGVINKEMGME
jgi:hypothetical protein